MLVLSDRRAWLSKRTRGPHERYYSKPPMVDVLGRRVTLPFQIWPRWPLLQSAALTNGSARRRTLAIPTYVKQRILDRYGWKCYLTKIDLRPLSGQIDFDHVIALCNGGEHRERNLAPIWRPKHREKTAADVSERAATDRKVAHHYGLERPKQKIARAPKLRIENAPRVAAPPLYIDDERTASATNEEKHEHWLAYLDMIATQAVMRCSDI